MDTLFLEKILDDLVELKSNVVCKNNDNNKSLKNLKEYLNLRSIDAVELQHKLSSIGLSSLSHAQSCVVDSINKDIEILSKLTGKEYFPDPNEQVLSYEESKKLMINNINVFGAKDDESDPHSFKTRVMVTLPSEAVDNEKLISDLILSGTSVLRINTAHDDPQTWHQMAKIIQNENIKQNKDTKIYVDLAGPKNRTGTIKKVFNPFKIGSWRNPKVVELIPRSKEGATSHKALKNNIGELLPARLVVSDEMYEACKTKSKIYVNDIERAKDIPFRLIKENDKIFAFANKKITIFKHSTIQCGKILSDIYNIELSPQEIRLFIDDEFIITPKDMEGFTNYKHDDNKIYSAIIGCTNKEIFPYVKEGDEIYIDDGKIGCVVTAIEDIGLICRVFLAKANGTILKEEKGINFPNTDLDISAITPIDEENFDHIVAFADIIGLSFAQSADDIKKLQAMLKEKDKEDIAIAPKIETKMALENLPQIFEQLLKSKNYAVMIARGDLAIEIGFENLPYIQDEIFDICEAAHVPVIYATQILEGKMKNNLPSRAEVTDAGFAQRADCVMLNKGPYVVDTVIILKNILRKAHMIFQKNRQLLSICKTWKNKI